MVLHVTYRCRPGQAAAFVQAVKDSGLQETIRAEDGCLQYDYHLSCEAPDTAVLIEVWRDAAAQSAHAAQPHMDKLMAVKSDYVIETKLARYE